MLAPTAAQHSDQAPAQALKRRHIFPIFPSIAEVKPPYGTFPCVPQVNSRFARTVRNV